MNTKTAQKVKGVKGSPKSLLRVCIKKVWGKSSHPSPGPLPLNPAKLENARERGGKIVAACPACREAGADTGGDHLVILASGKWGCVAHPGPMGKEHRRHIAELVGETAANISTATPPPVPRSACRPVPLLPAFRHPTPAELDTIRQSRRWPAIAGANVLIDRGQLAFAHVHDAGRTWPAWCVLDSTRANIQARKLDGGVWTGIGGKKAKSLPGTTTKRMIGAADIGDRPTVWIMEGQPDFVAAPILATLAGLDLDKIAFACVTGANENAEPLHPDDLRFFSGKEVVICPQRDPGHGLGERAAARWALQLYRAGAARVTGFQLRDGTKDMADHLASLDTRQPAPIDPPPAATPSPSAVQTLPAAFTPAPDLPAPSALADSPSPANAWETPQERPPLVPLESPWIEGARYRLAGAHEIPSRLPLFIQDDHGDTKRHGRTLIMVA